MRKHRLQTRRAKVLRYTVVLRPDEDGRLCVEVPALPGCFTYGDTYEEAVSNAREAIACYLASLRKDGEEIPTEHGPAVTTTVEVTV